MSVSTVSLSDIPAACPIPSLIVLPPPKEHSSPYFVISFSTLIHKSVAPSLTRSPVVGPNMLMYACRSIVQISMCAMSPNGSGSCKNPPAFNRSTMPCAMDASSTWPDAILFPPLMILLPAIWTNVTVLVSPGSKRTDVPEGMSSLYPCALTRSNCSCGFVSMKW